MTHVSANDGTWSKPAFLNCLFNPVTNTFYYISSKIIWKEERGAALLPRGLKRINHLPGIKCVCHCWRVITKHLWENVNKAESFNYVQLSTCESCYIVPTAM